jgi:hypothetical protein
LLLHELVFCAYAPEKNGADASHLFYFGRKEMTNLVPPTGSRVPEETAFL